MKKFTILLILGVLSFKVFAESSGREGDFESKLAKECANNNNSPTCLKLDISKWIDNVNQIKNYTIIPGVVVAYVKPTSDGGRSSEIIDGDIFKKFKPENRLDLIIFKKIVEYFNTHTVKLNLWNNFDKSEKSGEISEEEARRRRHRGGGMGMMMAAGAMMKGTLMAMGLAGVAALAGKALMTGMIAMMLSAIIGIKSLSGGGGKSTTYEVITKPIHTHLESHSSSHDDYGHRRSFELPLPLALQPQYQPA